MKITVNQERVRTAKARVKAGKFVDVGVAVFRVEHETGVMHAAEVEILNSHGHVVAVFRFDPTRRCGSAYVDVNSASEDVAVVLK